MKNEFVKFATSKTGVNSNCLKQYMDVTPPTIIEERKLNTASTDIFSRLMMDRIIFIGQPINDEISNIIQAQLLYLSTIDEESKISIYINTPGGLVSAGLAIYDTMQIVKAPIHTICTGLAASMGAVLLSAGEEGGRFALPHSRIMIHQPLGGTWGQASDILIEAQEMEKCRKELLTIISNHTGQPYKKVFKDADRDYWMSAEEALKYGMIDKVLA